MSKFYVKLSTLVGKVILKFKGIEYGKNLRLYGLPIITKHKNSSIKIGDNVVLCSNSKYTALGVNHPVIIRTLTSNAKIVIGNDVGMSGGVLCSAESVVIGNRVLIGANVSIFDTDFHSVNTINRRYVNDHRLIKSKNVFVGDDVFLGTGAIVGKGAFVGDGSVIGASSFVTGKIGKNEIWAGIPIKKVGNIVQ
jgi:acetyltransferase-like isoleucine patch superfamily enzyme